MHDYIFNRNILQLIYNLYISSLHSLTYTHTDIYIYIYNLFGYFFINNSVCGRVQCYIFNLQLIPNSGKGEKLQYLTGSVKFSHSYYMNPIQINFGGVRSPTSNVLHWTPDAVKIEQGLARMFAISNPLHRHSRIVKKKVRFPTL